MRRRLVSLLTAAILALGVVVPLAAVPALAAGEVDVLATEASTEGLEPMSPDDEDNEFAPEQYEPNWTWRAGKVLMGAFAIVLLYVGLMYYLRVARPRARSGQS